MRARGRLRTPIRWRSARRASAAAHHRGEIGRPEDIAAIEEVIHAGVTVVATAHGSSLAELRARPGLRRLLDEQVFERALILGWSRGAGTVEQLCDLKKDILSRRA